MALGGEDCVDGGAVDLEQRTPLAELTATGRDCAQQRREHPVGQIMGVDLCLGIERHGEAQPERPLALGALQGVLGAGGQRS